MLTDLKPNDQADSLHTETEVSENSHLQIEPKTDRQLLNKNASEDSDTLDFDYLTDFGGDKALIEEAKTVSKSFVSFLRRTFKDLIQLGNELWRICNKCVDNLGKTEGKSKFNRWLDAEFGNSQNLARTAMSLSRWYNTLKPAMQRLVAKNVKNWSVSALKELSKLTDDLVTKLVTSGKQTAQTIKAAHASHKASTLAPLTGSPSRAATADDWKSVFWNSSLTGQQKNRIKKNARRLASLYDTEIGSEPVVMVKHVNQAIDEYIEALKSTAPASKEVEQLPNISELQQMVLAIGVLTPVAKKGTKLWKNQMVLTRPQEYEEAPFPIEFRGKKDLMHWWEAKGKAFALNHPLPEEVQQSIVNQSPVDTDNTEAITELIAGAIAGDMEKEQAANRETSAKLQQALAEKNNTQAAQEEEINRAIAGELEKAAIAHQKEMESLRQTLSSQVKGMFTPEQVDEAIARDRSKRKGKVYTSEDVEKKIADAYKNMYTDEEVQEEIEFELRRERIQLKKEFDAQIAEVRASLLESADTAYAAKLASLEQALKEKDRTIASLEEQKATTETEELASLRQALTEKEQAIPSLEEQTAVAVAKARAEEREKTASEMASQITSLQQTLTSLQRALAEKDKALASLKEQQATTETEKVTSLQKELAEKDKAIASLEEQTAAAVTQARTEEKEKLEQAMASRLKSLQQALASSEKKAAAIAEARANERAFAKGDIRALQEEVKMLRAEENYSLQTTKEQLATACKQVEELKSQLTDSENKYKEKVRWLENDFNSVTKINIDNGKAIKLLESANQSMNQENRSLKEELASYKNIEKKIQQNYHKINQAENLKVENAKLVESLQSARQNLQGQINQSVSLASSVTQLNNIVDEILFLQQTLAKQGIPGCKKESYVSPQDGQEYQGVKGIVKLIQDMVSNNNFNLKTT